MESINQVILQGHLPRDARITPSKRGGQYAMFSLATAEKWIDKATKEQKSKTQYHSCTAWSVTPSEADFLRKSANVRVEGKIEYSVKTDKDGTTKNYTNIVIDYLEFIPSDGSRRSAPRQQQEEQPPQDQQSAPPPVTDEDLPF